MTKTSLLTAMAALANRIRLNGDNDAVSIETGVSNVLRLEQIARDIVSEGELDDATYWEDLAICCSALRDAYRRDGTDADGEATTLVNEAAEALGI